MSVQSRVTVVDPVMDQNDLFSAVTFGDRICGVGSWKKDCGGVLEQTPALFRTRLVEICKLKRHDDFLEQILY